MTLALPREIMNKVEQRWNARATQTETFNASRLKQQEQIVPEEPGARTSEAPIKRN